MKVFIHKKTSERVTLLSDQSIKKVDGVYSIVLYACFLSNKTGKMQIRKADEFHSKFREDKKTEVDKLKLEMNIALAKAQIFA